MKSEILTVSQKQEIIDAYENYTKFLMPTAPPAEKDKTNKSGKDKASAIKVNSGKDEDSAIQVNSGKNEASAIVLD